MKFGMMAVRWVGNQDWIRFGVRKRLVRLWCRFVDLDIPFEVEFSGYVYEGNLLDYIDRCVFFYGAYEKANLSLLRDLAGKISKPVFVDIGANVGQHSLWMAKHCAKVYSFEPWQPVRERLQSKVQRNHLNHVRTYEVGLGEREENLPFFSPPKGDTGIGSFIQTHHEWNKESGDTLPIRKGDTFFAEKGIKPDIIKIDVEGFELNVLKGLREVLAQHKPTVLLEFSNTTQEQFGSYETLTETFPYPVRIHRIVALEGWGYQLDTFSFQQCSDILIVPDSSNDG
jgi:FkbM family methyltransferase